MSHICVLGGSGFIGRYLVRKLIATGRKVTVIGRKSTSPFDRSVNYLYDGDKDPDFLQKALVGVDEVIEMAYSSVPQTSFQNPVKDIFENLAFSVRLFETLLHSGVHKVLYVSSGGTIYGQAMYSPIDENHQTDPVSPYGITKLAIEKYGLMYHFTNKLPIVIVRPANAYGEGQIPFRGQGFIATAIATIMRGDPIRIFGEEGTIRDYIYVDDVASGILAALEHGEIGECYNIGTGIGRNNLQIVEELASFLKEAGYESRWEFLPPRAFDVRENILDSRKLTNISKWAPQMDLRTGLSNTVAWFNENKGTIPGLAKSESYNG